MNQIFSVGVSQQLRNFKQIEKQKGFVSSLSRVRLLLLDIDLLLVLAVVRRLDDFFDGRSVDDDSSVAVARAATSTVVVVVVVFR